MSPKRRSFKGLLRFCKKDPSNILKCLSIVTLSPKEIHNSVKPYLTRKSSTNFILKSKWWLLYLFAFLVFFVKWEKPAIGNVIALIVTIIGASLAYRSYRNSQLALAESEINNAWARLADKKPGNSGKIEAIHTLLKYNKPLTKLDLSSPDKENSVYLRKLKAQGGNFQGAKFNYADLSFAHFEDAVLWGAHFEGAILSGANFEEAKLSEAHFEGADLWGANFKKAPLLRAHFEGADLRCAYFKDAALSPANCEGADLRWAYFEGSILSGANFEGAVFYRTMFIDCKGVEMIKDGDLYKFSAFMKDEKDVKIYISVNEYGVYEMPIIRFGEDEYVNALEKKRALPRGRWMIKPCPNLLNICGKQMNTI